MPPLNFPPAGSQAALLTTPTKFYTGTRVTRFCETSPGVTPRVGAAAERARGQERPQVSSISPLPTTDSNGGIQHEQRLVLEPSSTHAWTLEHDGGKEDNFRGTEPFCAGHVVACGRPLPTSGVGP